MPPPVGGHRTPSRTSEMPGGGKDERACTRHEPSSMTRWRRWVSQQRCVRERCTTPATSANCRTRPIQLMTLCRSGYAPCAFGNCACAKSSTDIDRVGFVGEHLIRQPRGLARHLVAIRSTTENQALETLALGRAQTTASTTRPSTSGGLVGTTDKLTTLVVLDPIYVRSARPSPIWVRSIASAPRMH